MKPMTRQIFGSWRISNRLDSVNNRQVAARLCAAGERKALRHCSMPDSWIDARKSIARSQLQGCLTRFSSDGPNCPNCERGQQ